jgi:hypothetical protein
VHHFAHDVSSNCATSIETALHLAAKKILERAGYIVVPALELLTRSTRYSRLLQPKRRISLAGVKLEQRIGSLIPDVVAETELGQLAVEIKVSHAVDEAKIARFRELGMSALEIDLSDVRRDLPLSGLTPLVLDSAERKTWAHNQELDTARSGLFQAASAMKSIYRGYVAIVRDCPIYARALRGRGYAEVELDCSACEHAVEIAKYSSSIVCAASSNGIQGRLFD